MPHRDISESSSAPLVSLSRGCEALSCGGWGEEKIVVRVMSGDAVVVNGEARRPNTLCSQLSAGYVLSGRSRGGLDRSGKGQFECEADVGFSARNKLFRERNECMVTRAQIITG